jgi:hypothetical protein
MWQSMIFFQKINTTWEDHTSHVVYAKLLIIDCEFSHSS